MQSSYKAICRNRKNLRGGGGLAILIRNAVKKHIVEEEDMECVWLRIGQETVEPFYLRLYYE